jgi:hypothetical protein
MLAELKAATFEVLETMFFLFPESLEEERRVRGPFLRAWVTIAGPQSLRLGLLVPQNLARKMAANFLGVSEEEIYQPEMEDVLRETVNMMAGALLSRMEASGAFKLQTPKAEWISEDGQKPKAPANRLLFEVEEDVLELFVEKG